MIETTAAYKAAITGDARKILLKAIIDIISPDIVYGFPASSGFSSLAKPEQLHSRKIDTYSEYVTLELNRWGLDGTFELIPEEGLPGEVAGINETLSGFDGTFSIPQWMELVCSGVSVLQACSVYFPTNNNDGIPVDFTIDVMQGGTAYFTKTFEGNTEKFVRLNGFTVNNPDAIRITVSKWSLPYTRMRIPEIYPGLYEEWDNSIIAAFNVKQQGNFACTALPYGTCTLSMDNLDRRFEPRNKAGIFQSIEERQKIPVLIGVELENGVVDYKQIGVFYQYSGGWKTSDNGLTMQWNLVDIIGLVANREFIPPATLPVTLQGWLEAIVSQLGKTFLDQYIANENYANASVTADPEKIAGLKCGDILRFVCMATGTWPRADSLTGKLVADPFWNQGNALTLENLVDYPVMKANNDIAAIIFTLSDGTKYTVSGNSTNSSATVSVNNPFIHTQEQALEAAKMILSVYGGNRIETTGRGDPSSEIGDVTTLELSESNAITGRLAQQTFEIHGGVMRDCKSVFLQPNGVFIYQGRALITESGIWTAPSGATKLRIVVGNGGNGGSPGKDGTWEQAGDAGNPGIGGKILDVTIDINEGQTFSVSIGSGGAPGQNGETTTFGDYSGANGKVFSPSYTDINSGNAYGRTGVKLPLANTGDGGAGGNGGKKGNRHTEETEDGPVNVIDNRPGAGKEGVAGASGFVLVYWNKEAL